MNKKIIAYRLGVAVLAASSAALALSGYIGNIINTFYFPGTPAAASHWVILGLALLAISLVVEIFVTALPKALRRKRHGQKPQV